MPRIYTRRPLIDRVFDHVTDVGGHWIWTGSTGSSGYGKIQAGGSQREDLLVHRVTWGYFRGPIPAGLVLDHLDECLDILCCNPFTCLEPVTQAVNRARQASRRLACDAGHVYTPESTRITKDGKRECRICHAGRVRAARQRQKTVRQAKFDTHCSRGHLRTPENTWMRDTGPTCRDCMSESARHRRAAARELSGSGSPA